MQILGLEVGQSILKFLRNMGKPCTASTREGPTYNLQQISDLWYPEFRRQTHEHILLTVTLGYKYPFVFKHTMNVGLLSTNNQQCLSDYFVKGTMSNTSFVSSSFNSQNTSMKERTIIAILY